MLASPEILERAGIELHHTDRGGDVTYHGPGQIVGYPIVDLREWKRDVVAYVRALEQVLIEALAEFGIAGGRMPGATGVWVDGAKVAAIGVHISRWVTSHGFALNLDTDLDYFKYIVPCGLTQPVTSMRALGCHAGRAEVSKSVAAAFGRRLRRDVFGRCENGERMIDVEMPQMGESIVEGTLTKWLKKPGDKVERDEPLFEISTDKVDTEIPSPVAGTLAEILVEEGKTVGINTVVGRISDGARTAAPARLRAARSPARPLRLLRRPRLLRLLRKQPSRSRMARRMQMPLRPLLRIPGRWSKKPPVRFRRWSARWRARTISI